MFTISCGVARVLLWLLLHRISDGVPIEQQLAYHVHTSVAKRAPLKPRHNVIQSGSGIHHPCLLPTAIVIGIDISPSSCTSNVTTDVVNNQGGALTEYTTLTRLLIDDNELGFSKILLRSVFNFPETCDNAFNNACNIL